MRILGGGALAVPTLGSTNVFESTFKVADSFSKDPSSSVFGFSSTRVMKFWWGKLTLKKKRPVATSTESNPILFGGK